MSFDLAQLSDVKRFRFWLNACSLRDVTGLSSHCRAEVFYLTAEELAEFDSSCQIDRDLPIHILIECTLPEAKLSSSMLLPRWLSRALSLRFPGQEDRLQALGVFLLFLTER
ncbi:hypothetical protein CCO03_08615 [Comamonas serinivorans]|uniref:Uncharacterized protein n=1 Tax=Comamonas serinivorans TaxID=1082851 RepID=A0A1Y0EN50_9BURK|nr:hypothetical protein CCO03_08615 [Comamonas serinivorans]